MSAIFYQIFIFYQMIDLQKLRKMFISSRKLFSFSIYSNFYICCFPYFFLVSHCFWGLIKRNLKVYDVINCLNENLIAHFAWYLEKEIRCDIENLSIDGEYGKFLWKNPAENVHQKLARDPFLILLNNPKQPLHVINSFRNKIFWKRIIKTPLKR